MKRFIALVSLMTIVAGAGAAVAQTSAPPPPPASKAMPTAYRYGGLSGAWLIPNGDFANIASDGWAIVINGEQFINPSKKIAVGSEVGYYSFGKKNGIGTSNFPVDAVLKFFPKADAGKLRPFAQGGLGFNYTRTEVGNSSRSDYYFGTQAGFGAELHGDGPAALMIDGIYHWVFATGTDLNFWSIRGGILVPIMR